jgi:hypothetical protein
MLALTYVLHLWLPRADAPEPVQGRVVPQMSEAIVLGNTARRLSGREFEWTAYVMGPDKLLDDIKCVEFVLHPTFPEPVRSVCSRGDVPGKGFALKATGWGTFKLGATVTLKSGQSFYLTHVLHFSVDAEGAAYVPAGFKDQEIAVPVTASTPQDGSFRFTVALQKTGDRVSVRVARVEIRNDGSSRRAQWGFTLSVNGDDVIELPVRSYFSLGKGKAMELNVSGTVPASNGSMLLRIQGRH